MAINKHISATGIIIPVDWDEKGNPKVVAISTENEQEFIVNPKNKQGKALQNLLQQRVTVYGRLSNTPEERTIITVKHFQQMEYYAFD